MENKNYIWRPVSEYTGGRVLATNGLDMIIGEINSEGDCESEEDGSTILCGITGFIKTEEILPELKEGDDERIRKDMIETIKKEARDFPSSVIAEKSNSWIAWLEKQGEQNTDKIVEKAKTEKQRVLLTETDGTANIDWDCRSLDDVKFLLKCGLEFIRAIEANKQILSDNRFGGSSLRVPTRYDKGIKQGEQKPVDFSDLRTWKYIVDAVLTEKEGIGQYLDSPFTEEVANKLQKRFGNIDKSKQEWSEEDKVMLGEIIDFFENGTVKLQHDLSLYASWLKSIRPRKQWKPSDEQMYALEKECIAHSNYELCRLLEQLKKLKQ